MAATDRAARDAYRILVTAGWVPARREPSHRSEMVTQWVCGEELQTVERRAGWRRLRGPDRYEGWGVGGGLVPVGEEEAEAWQRAAVLVSFGTALEGVDGREVPAWLPWGARVAPAGGGRVQLPDGAAAMPVHPEALVPVAELPQRFPTDGGAVVATAARWLGVPYVWGGRTRWGADCSGLVQSVLAVHGVRLPRDSHLQAAAGPDTGWRPGRGLDFSPGDLLFFAPEGGRISHVGIGIGGSRVLHCSETNGRAALDDLAGGRPLERSLRGSLVSVTRPLG